MNKIFNTTLILFLVFSTLGCTKDTGPVLLNLEYRIHSNKIGFDVTFIDGNGDTYQHEINKKSETIKFQAYPDTYVSILAQSDNEDATITVEIYRESELIKSITSSGDYAIAIADTTI